MVKRVKAVYRRQYLLLLLPLHFTYQANFTENKIWFRNDTQSGNQRPMLYSCSSLDSLGHAVTLPSGTVM